MKKASLWVAAIVLCCGCNSATPSFNPLAPYGATRIPPPGTGSFARPDSYYQPSSRTGFSDNGTRTQDAPVGSGVVLASGTTKSSNGSLAPTATASSTKSSGGVKLVSMDESKSYVAPAPTTKPRGTVQSSEPPIRVIESPTGTSGSSSAPKGMTVNDGTKIAEPQPFQPAGEVKDLAQFPRSAASGSLPTARSPAAATPSQSSPVSPSASGSGGNSDEWKTRDNGRKVIRVAGR